jgi:gliding motility-associated-like protein
VEDTTAPVIDALPEASTMDCPAAPAFAQATATDACGSAITLTFEDVTAPGTCANAYSVTRTWTATDACGNASTATQTINVQDVTAPVITAEAQNLTVECDGSGNQNAIADWLANNGGAVAADTCSDVTWTNDFDALSSDCSAAVTVMFTATDACGNAVSTSATFTVQDATAPVAPEAPATANVSCADEIPSTISLTASDNCSGDVTVEGVDAVTPGACANSFTVTRTWTFVDACGNQSSVSQTINVNDNIAPVAPEAPAAINVACLGEIPAAGELTATDNCDDQITVTGEDSVQQGSCANSFVVTRTWTFADACGNTSSVSQVINVNDNIAPVIAALPATTTIACPATPEFAQAVATDNCAGDVTLTFNDVTTNGACAGSYSVTRTWTATDACGNTASATQTINVEDTSAPVIDALPETATIDCPATPEFAQATATDACGSDFTLTFEDTTTQGTCTGSYSVTRTWTATDACGNASTATQTINVQDVTAPVITAEAQNLTVECDGSGNQNAIADWLANHGGATATDACSDVTWTNDFDALSSDCSAAVTVMFTATDACGNASATSATFTVQDVTAPVAPTAPETANVTCAGDVPAMVSLTAADNCAGTITVEGVDAVAPGACANSFTVTRTWTFVDACGNQSSVSQTINVNDDVAPVAPAAPENVTVACSGDVPAMVSLTATDNCGDEITVEGTDVIAIEIGACPNDYVITRTWAFIDACGNASSVSQTITVNDDIAPVAPAAPENMNVSCAGEIPAMISLTATDNCGDMITVEGVDTTAEGECANSFVVTRTWTFTDACGNTSSVSQTINVNDDIAPVAPAAPETVNVSCSAEVPAMVSLTATDNCAEQITVEGVDAIVQGECPNSFVVTRTWTFVDACGNQSSVSQTINVNDTTAPVAPAAPENVTVTCFGDVPAMVSLTATDNCGDEITVDGVDSNVGDCANNATITRTWTFTDACGNQSSVSQTITVNDNIDPVFTTTAPANITVSCDAVPTPATMTAADNCGIATVDLTETIKTNPQGCSGMYSIIRTWTASDACGNSVSAVQVIDVQDVTAPTFVETLPADAAVSCDAIPTAPILTAVDNCGDATVAFNETIVPGACPSSSVITRTWTATDACGNPTIHTQTITVSDNAGPVLDGTIESPVNVSCSEIPAVPTPTFTDNCSAVGTPVYAEAVSNQTADGYTITRTWTVADACNNETVVTQVINISVANGTQNVPSESCQGDISPINLDSVLQQLLPGTETGGTWTDLDNTGGLNGNIWMPSNVAQLGTYQLQYEITEGACPRTIIIDMEVNDDCLPEGCGNVVIHNAFSPNGDEVNTHFHIDNIDADCYVNNKVEIYNRWGVLVYETTNYDNEENAFKGYSEGRVTVDKGTELPTGTYFYIVQWTDTQQGNVVVKKDGYLYLSR